jgi:hypothetical protein
MKPYSAHPFKGNLHPANKCGICGNSNLKLNRSKETINWRKQMEEELEEMFLTYGDYYVELDGLYYEDEYEAN